MKANRPGTEEQWVRFNPEDARSKWDLLNQQTSNVIFLIFLSVCRLGGWSPFPLRPLFNKQLNLRVFETWWMYMQS